MTPGAHIVQREEQIKCYRTVITYYWDILRHTKGHTRTVSHLTSTPGRTQGWHQNREVPSPPPLEGHKGPTRTVESSHVHPWNDTRVTPGPWSPPTYTPGRTQGSHQDRGVPSPPPLEDTRVTPGPWSPLTFTPVRTHGSYQDRGVPSTPCLGQTVFTFNLLWTALPEKSNTRRGEGSDGYFQ